jgi:hypothetical protein
MEIVEEDNPQYTLAMGNIPEHFFFTAVQKCLPDLGKRPETIMEIVTMTHLNDYFHRICPELRALIIVPTHLEPHCLFFMAGYKFIEHLYDEVNDFTPVGALAAVHDQAAAALLN